MNKDFWINQSKSFDKSANYYDKYRPSYPSELVTDLIAKTGVDCNSKIIEVGAGSGKATELFVQKGLNITCIEPGANLALEGMEKFKSTGQVEYIVGRFEDWAGTQESYDLIFSAQAFHWVPKPQGYEICYKALKTGKHIGLFWNYYYTTGERIEEDLYNFFGEYPVAYIAKREGLEKMIQNNVEEIEDSGYFKSIEVLKYPWSQVSTTEEYLGFIKTGNGYLTLNEEEKKIVEERLTEILESNGGSILRSYQCTLFLAERV